MLLDFACQGRVKGLCIEVRFGEAHGYGGISDKVSLVGSGLSDDCPVAVPLLYLAKGVGPPFGVVLGAFKNDAI